MHNETSHLLTNSSSSVNNNGVSTNDIIARVPYYSTPMPQTPSQAVTRLLLAEQSHLYNDRLDYCLRFFVLPLTAGLVGTFVGFCNAYFNSLQHSNHDGSTSGTNQHNTVDSAYLRDMVIGFVAGYIVGIVYYNKEKMTHCTTSIMTHMCDRVIQGSQRLRQQFPSVQQESTNNFHI